MREARIHVRHVRDLLKSLDPSDAFNGVDCNSLSFLSVFTDGDLGGEGGIGARVGQRGQEQVSQWLAKGLRARPSYPGGWSQRHETGASVGGEMVGPWVALC